MAHVETEPKLMGRSVTMTLAPLPKGKRKRRFFSVHDLEPLEDEDEDDDDTADEDAEKEA
jgi:translation initiation factor IF-3